MLYAVLAAAGLWFFINSLVLNDLAERGFVWATLVGVQYMLLLVLYGVLGFAVFGTPVRTWLAGLWLLAVAQAILELLDTVIVWCKMRALQPPRQRR